MKKSISYIIKKIIIGVGIILVLGFINSCEVNAATVGSYQFPKALYQLIGSDTLNIPVNNAFSGFGYGHVTFTFASKDLASLDNNPIRSVAVYTSNGGGAFNCEVTSNTISSTGYVFYSANCPANVWSGYAISNIEIKVVNVSSSTAGPYNIYMSNFMSFYGGENAEVVAAINAANIKDQILTIMQQLVTIDNRIATNFNTLIDYLNSKLDSQIQLQQQQIQKQQETNDFLKDTSTPSGADVEDITGNIKSENANVSDLVTLPITAINTFTTGLSRGCYASYDLGNLLGTNLIIPCINPSNYLGDVLWATIDIMMTLGFVWVFKNWLINKYFELTSLKEAKFK